MKLLIVDDHNLFRKSLINLINGSDGMEVIGEASSGLEALEKLESLSPDMILMDISMPGMSGIETTLQVKTKNPHIKVVMLSAHSEDEYIQQSLVNGASGYLSKNADQEEFLNTLQRFMEESVEEEESRRTGLMDQLNPVSQKVKLTVREIEIITAIAEGLTTNEIAEKLYISPKTVNNHRSNIFNKLGVKNSVELIRFAIKDNIISI